MIHLDLAARGQAHRAVQPFGVRDQTDLHEDAFQIDVVMGVGVAVLVGQARHLLAVAMHLSRQGRGHDPHVRQGRQLALQHRIGPQLAVVFDQGHMGHDARQVDRRLDA